MVLCSAILPKKCFVIVFGMSKYVPLASKIKLCIIMLIAVTSRHFEGGFWWCTKKKMNFLKKYFSREVIIGIIAGDILLLLSILTRYIV